MSAPSVELLRALRRAINKSSLSTTSGTLHRVVSPTYKVTVPPSTSSKVTMRCIRSFSTSLPSRVDSPQPLKRVQEQQAQVSRHNPYAPTHHDRGPRSTEDTQTDFDAMDVLGHVATPATSIDACTTDGFHLNNGVRVTGGSGIVLVGGEAWSWKPWEVLNGSPEARKIGDLLDARRGILHLPQESLGLLELLYPKPDLLIVGTGSRLWMLSQETRRYIAEVLGCKLDVMDTGNASAAYNLLAKERGVDGGSGVGALLLPLGWKGPMKR